VERCGGKAQAQRSALGWTPGYEDLDWSGREEFTPEEFARLTAIDSEAWKQELALHAEWFAKLGERVPAALIRKHALFSFAFWH